VDGESDQFAVGQSPAVGVRTPKPPPMCMYGSKLVLGRYYVVGLGKYVSEPNPQLFPYLQVTL